MKINLQYNDFSKEIEIEIDDKIGVIQEKFLLLCSLVIYNIEYIEIFIKDKKYILGSEEVPFDRVFSSFLKNDNSNTEDTEDSINNTIIKFIINDRKRDEFGNVIKENIIIDNYNKWYQSYQNELYINNLSSINNTNLSNINNYNNFIYYVDDTLRRVNLARRLFRTNENIAHNVAESIFNDSPSGDVPSGDVPSGDAPSVDAPSGDAPSGDAPSGDASQTDAPSNNMFIEDSIFGDVFFGDIPLRDISLRNISLRDITLRNILFRDAPSVDAPPLDAPSVDAPPVEAPSTDDPSDDAPSVDAPSLDAPSLDAPSVDAPSVDAPLEDPPINSIRNISIRTLENNLINNILNRYNNNYNYNYSIFDTINSNNILNTPNRYPVFYNLFENMVEQNMNEEDYIDMPSLISMNGEHIYEDVIVGLNEDQFNELESCVFTSECKQKDCLICMEEYIEEEEDIIKLNCEHTFHKNCIKQWLCKESNKCPVCRIEVHKGVPLNI